MKQYVLDEPGMEPACPASAAPVPVRHRWRWPIAAASVGAAILVAAIAFVEGRPEIKPAVEAEAIVPAYIAPAVVEAPRAVVEPAATTVEPPPSSHVTREHGRYVVALSAAAIGPTLAMLSAATHTTVTGGDVVVASPSRITTSFVASSPLEAWTGVFGNLASFAMSCGRSSCAVRFVSLIGEDPSSPSSLPSNRTQPTALAPIAAPPTIESSEQPMPDN